MINRTALSRRTFVGLATAATLGQTLRPVVAGTTMARRRIPGTAEDLPVIGLGTSDEFGRMPADGGLRSMRNSTERLRESPLDLMMVHSLVDADTQLDNLQRWKEDGRVRYIGITTSRRCRHDQPRLRQRPLLFAGARA